MVQAIKAVASRLGNTPSVCRKCYIHPAVLDAYLTGNAIESAGRKVDKEITKHAQALREEERNLIALLQQRLLLEKAR